MGPYQGFRCQPCDLSELVCSATACTGILTLSMLSGTAPAAPYHHSGTSHCRCIFCLLSFHFQTSFDEILLHFKYNTFLPVCKHAIPNYFCSHFVFMFTYTQLQNLSLVEREIAIKNKDHRKNLRSFCGWGGRIQTFGMTESESVTLPLGDTPMFVRLACFGWDRWIRTIGMTESKSAALPLGYIHRHVPHSNSLIIIAPFTRNAIPFHICLQNIYSVLTYMGKTT